VRYCTLRVVNREYTVYCLVHTWVVLTTKVVQRLIGIFMLAPRVAFWLHYSRGYRDLRYHTQRNATRVFRLFHVSSLRYPEYCNRRTYTEYSHSFYMYMYLLISNLSSNAVRRDAPVC
jgi:hypothetical protein